MVAPKEASTYQNDVPLDALSIGHDNADDCRAVVDDLHLQPTGGVGQRVGGDVAGGVKDGLAGEKAKLGGEGKDGGEKKEQEVGAEVQWE
ncbi:hypothetical protein TYRP_007850 [Tyrophagus putrescentiae]|nr:hypothetical protein TYRP_007850 [Tyrophagus putrescentiae]